MNLLNSTEIDAIVQAVIVELRKRAAKTQSRSFEGRLFGAKQAEALGSEERELLISKGTVVTPLAVDVLKQRKITLTYVSERDGRTRENGEWAFAIDQRTSGKADLLRRVLRNAWSELSMSDAVPWLIAAPNRGALLLTDEASLACWKANRVDGVRAASAGDPDTVARAVRHLGVNMLVVEPAGLPMPYFKTMVETYRRAGAPSRPEGLP